MLHCKVVSVKGTEAYGKGGGRREGCGIPTPFILNFLNILNYVLRPTNLLVSLLILSYHVSEKRNFLVLNRHQPASPELLMME